MFSLEEPFPRVFIATSPGNELAETALINSILDNTSGPVGFHLMREGNPPFDNWPRMVTPFTMFRWAIPELCGYEGHAIYLDVDMIMLGDVHDLWAHRNKGDWICSGRDDVSIINCEKFRHLPKMVELKKMGREGKFNLKALTSAKDVIPAEWNCHDYMDENTKLLHFTDVHTQPWKPWPLLIDYKDHPNQDCVDCWKGYAGIL